MEVGVLGRTMPKFLWLATLFLISCAAGFAQESQKPAAQANPCDSATTQAELNECSDEEFLKTDEHLNAVYKNLSGMLQQAAAEAKEQKDETLTKKADTAIQKLRAAQTAWTQYRSLHCDAVKQQFEGGSIAELQWTACMMQTANDRIAE